MDYNLERTQKVVSFQSNLSNDVVPNCPSINHIFDQKHKEPG